MNRIKLTALSLGVAAAYTALPACGQTSNTQEPPAMMTPKNPEVKTVLETEIIAVMEAMKADWNAGRYDVLKRHWDMSDSMPIYLAEESDTVMTSWPQIDKYWKGTDAWNEWIVVDYYNYQVKSVDENHAMITFDLRFDVKLNDRPNPIGGDNRGVVSLRKVDGEWKIYAWVEAPLAAITYMRKLYELNVREDLPHLKK